MTPINKGIVAIVVGVLALFNPLIVVLVVDKLASLSSSSSSSGLSYGLVLFIIGTYFFCSITAIYLGVQARKGDAKILGLIGLVLGIVGVVSTCVQSLMVLSLVGIQ